MVSSDGSAHHSVSSDEARQRASPCSDVTLSQGIPDTEIPPSTVAENAVKGSDSTAFALPSAQEGNTHSSSLEKHLHSPETPLPEFPPFQSGQGSPSIIREKVTKDGYNWRKYGQKFVKGNEFIRSYYKCTHPNCQAKKQLQQLTNGHITDSICIGQHNHPRPQSNTTEPVHCVLPVAEPGLQKPSSANVEDKSSVEHGCTPQEIKPLPSPPASKVPPADELKAAHLQMKVKGEVHSNEDSESKRLKKNNGNAAAAGVDMSTYGSRVVVQTSSEVDFVNDGYRWRKYGQKLVRGNTNPRSYYRCSNPGCPVKKHVERASHDSKIVITTYEGQHDHEIPPGRSVAHNAATDTHTMATNGKTGTKYESSVVSVDTGSKSRLDEQVNEESMTKSKVSDMVEFHAIHLSSEGPESKSKEQEQQNDDSGAKDDSVSNDILCHSSSEVICRTNENLKDEVEAISEGSKDCLNVAAVHDIPSTES